MPHIKQSLTTEDNVPNIRLGSGACLRCNSHSLAATTIAPISEHVLAVVQRSPGLAGARHRQFFQPSPAEVVATGISGATADSVTLHLEGTIAAIPHSFDLTFALDLPNERLVVTLNGSQPAGNHASWTFKLHPLSVAAPGADAPSPVHYGSALLVDAAVLNLGGVIGCVVKCLGPQLIAIVLECLPALITGKQAFLACLVQQAQSSLPGVVQCIQQCK